MNIFRTPRPVITAVFAVTCSRNIFLWTILVIFLHCQACLPYLNSLQCFNTKTTPEFTLIYITQDQFTLHSTLSLTAHHYIDDSGEALKRPMAVPTRLSTNRTTSVSGGRLNCSAYVRLVLLNVYDLYDQGRKLCSCNFFVMCDRKIINFSVAENAN